MQDDAEPCQGFDKACRAALAAKPDEVVCFYVGGGRIGWPVERAAAAGLHWAVLDPKLWVPLVATAFPRGIIEELLAWAENDPFAAKSRGDDSVVGKFMRERRHTTWATIPNLVQHSDVVPSVLRSRNAAGRNISRVSVCYIGEEDPTQITW